jgi:hypothetical protein
LGYILGNFFTNASGHPAGDREQKGREGRIGISLFFGLEIIGLK